MQQGIILRSYFPQKQKITILDYNLGKIEVIVARQKRNSLCVGAVIEYNLRQWRNLYILSEYKIVEFPFEWANEKLLFLHFILELSYYFLPLHEAESEIFNLLMILYKKPEIVETKTFKKIYLCKFFNILGVYPYIEDDPILLKIIDNPLNFAFKIAQNKLIDKKIQKWINDCINTHYLAHKMKTTHFLKKLYDVDYYE